MMVALQLPLWGKALSKYPAFLVNQGVGSVGWGDLRELSASIHAREKVKK